MLSGQDGLENILRGQIECIRDKRKQRVTYLGSMTKWMTEQRLGEIAGREHLLRATRDRKLRRALISYVLIFKKN